MRLEPRSRWVLAAVALLVAGCGSAGGDSFATGGDGTTAAGAPTGHAGDPGAGSPAGSSGPAAAADRSPAAAGEPSNLATSFPDGIEPQGLEIPAIGVDATVVRLDVRGPEPEVPTDFDEAGWYEQTRRPGQIGPSVIAGHIDSVRGPAVFARLDELQVGDQVIVRGAAGDAQTFVVTGSGQYPKEMLPDEVFGFGGPVPELRLITCGGSFDRSSGHYQDNYVVYAELAVQPS